MHIATAENTQTNIGNVAISSTKEVASIVTHYRYAQVSDTDNSETSIEPNTSKMNEQWKIVQKPAAKIREKKGGG